MLNEYDALGMGFNNPRKTSSFFKISLFVIGTIVALFLMAYLCLVGKNAGKVKAIYTVTIYTFQGNQTYLVSDYKTDSLTHKCIEFTEITGIKHSTCNTFMVTSY